MLIKATNHCGMGCSHCMEGSTLKGNHMTWSTFERALDLTARLEVLAWEIGYRRLLLSGGECTDNPELPRMIDEAHRRGYEPWVLTHGMWLDDEAKRKEILRPEWTRLVVQVTNDPRFYPKRPASFGQPIDPRIYYVGSLSAMIPLGRFAGKTNDEVRTRKAPSSFNVRSITRSTGDIRKALLMLRMRALAGSDGNCAPSITHEGDLMAGETRNCFRIGTVDSTPEEITKAILSMRCNACGLVSGLSPEHKRAIGESTLYGAGEGP